MLKCYTALHKKMLHPATTAADPNERPLTRYPPHISSVVSTSSLQTTYGSRLDAGRLSS